MPRTFPARVKLRLLRSMVVALLLAGSGPEGAVAQSAPDSVSFQGYVTDSGGTPVNATTSMTFKFYEDGSPVWSEIHPSVTVTDGVFNVLLGSVSRLDTLAFDQPIELGIKVGADPEISPRTPLGAAPFALGMRGMYSVWREDGPHQGFNIIGGGPNNTVSDFVVGATIAGGGGFSDGFSDPNSVTGYFGSVGGGHSNTAGYESTVAGGLSNSASGIDAAIGGGNANEASGLFATVGGGQLNKATGENSTVPGGKENAARGSHSFAAGFNARADHAGSFVWADRSVTGSDDTLATTGANQFIVRAVGGVGIGTNAPGTTLDVIGGNWDLASSEGDLRIGTSAQRLKIGVATAGNGAGVARINAVGTLPRVLIGTNNADIVNVTPSSFEPFVDDAIALGTSSRRWTVIYAASGTVNSSDRRMKRDIRGIRYGIDEVMRLVPVSFKWKDRPESGDQLGLIAQDVDQVVPEVVDRGNATDDMLGLNYSELIPVLIKAIQEQQTLIERQQQRLALLEARLMP